MPEEIKAHITGVVFQITTKPGDRVAAGDAVIVLESMKMEIPVEAPRAGAVKEIKVQEGQTVQEDNPKRRDRHTGGHSSAPGRAAARAARLHGCIDGGGFRPEQRAEDRGGLSPQGPARAAAPARRKSRDAPP